MTWLLSLVLAINPDADRQMRLQPDSARVSVGPDGKLQHVAPSSAAEVDPNQPLNLPEEGRESPPAAQSATKLSNEAYEDFKSRPDDMPKVADPGPTETDEPPVDEKPGKTSQSFANVSPPKGFLPQACAKSVVGENSGASVAASSSKPGHGPALSIIDEDPSHAWIAEENSQTQWIEYTWPEAKEIRYLQAGGLDTPQGSLTRFKIQYKGDDGAWKWYKRAADEGAAAFTSFKVEATAPNVELVALNPPLQTRAMKVWAIQWESNIAFRADIKGCPASEVEAATLDLNVPKTNLFPQLFENFNSLNFEFRSRISQQLQVPLDQVQVISAEASPDGSKSIINIHILPKDGSKAPADIITDLEATLKDQGSALSTFLNDVENSQTRVATVNKQHQCTAVDCGDHGTCMGGKCFCVEGYSGKHCETRYDKTKPLLNENGEQIDPKTGEVVITVDEEQLPMDSVSPLGLLPTGAIPPAPPSDEQNEIEEKDMTEDEVDEDVEEIAAKNQEEILDEEEGVSGVVKRHVIIVAGVALAFVACGAVAVLAAGRKKGEALLGGDSDADSNPRVAERD